MFYALSSQGKQRTRDELKLKSIPSQHTPPVIKTPGKSKAHSSQTTQKSGPSDEEVTPKATPNVSFNQTQDMYSSEEETPRERDISNHRMVAATPAATVTKQPEKKYRPPTPRQLKPEATRPTVVKEDVKPKRTSVLQVTEMPTVVFKHFCLTL